MGVSSNFFNTNLWLWNFYAVKVSRDGSWRDTPGIQFSSVSKNPQIVWFQLGPDTWISITLTVVDNIQKQDNQREHHNKLV